MTLTKLDELCTPDMVNHALAPDRPAGLAGTWEFLQTQGRHQMTGQHWVELVVADGDAWSSSVEQRRLGWW
ncbi:MAG: hypothetical protein ACOYBY_12910 [Dermatophilaceae bacterium]